MAALSEQLAHLTCLSLFFGLLPWISLGAKLLLSSSQGPMHFCMSRQSDRTTILLIQSLAAHAFNGMHEIQGQLD
jgi:hypothetical protein